MTPALKHVPDRRGYRVIATKPLRARQFDDLLGDAADSLWSPAVYGDQATFGARTYWGVYARANVPTEARASRYGSRGTELSTHRGFQRYRVPTGTQPVVTAFDDTAEYVLTAQTDEPLQSLSTSLIDLHHGDGHNWQREREPYATLIEHLPQGVMTIVYPTGRQKRGIVEAAFGQTARVSGDTDRVQLRTVVVYPSFVDSAAGRTDQRLRRDAHGMFPVIDPTVSVTGNVAVIDDHAPASEIRWV